MHFTNQQLDERHMCLLAQFLTDWPHRMDTIQQAVWLFNNTNCPWGPLQTWTVLFHGMFLVFKHNLFSVANSNISFFFDFLWPLKYVSDYWAPRMGSARLLLIQMKNGLLNWSLCRSDTCHTCGCKVILCFDQMSEVGHVTTSLPFWFPKTEH